MSKHHKYRSYAPAYAVTPEEGLTLDILAQAEKAGAKAGYAVAKEQLYRSIGGNSILNEQQTDELLAAAERAGAAAALSAARKVLDKTLRTSFKHHHYQSTPPTTPIASAPAQASVATSSSPANYEEPLAKYSPPLSYMEPPRKKVDQHVLTITRVERLNDQMVRIIAGAPDLDGYRSNGALDEYVKVFVADPALGLEPPYDLRALRHRLPREQVPRSKSYTVRWVNSLVPEIAIDFVVHGEPGTVGHWAGTVQPGAPLVISPARSKSSVSFNADYYVLAADEAGLPAICKVLEALPETAQGTAFIEVASNDAMFDVKHPQGVVLHWLSREAMPAGRSTVLVDALSSLQLPHSRLGVIAHAERSTIKGISHVMQHWHLDKRTTHISSYWTLREGRMHR